MSTRVFLVCLLTVLFTGVGCVKAADDDLAPSPLTGAEVRLLLQKADVTTDDLHHKLDTLPILVNDGTFHWQLRDGSLWTSFQTQADGRLRVVAWQLESDSASATGGEMVELDKAFTFYYLEPAPQRIADLIASASRLRVLDNAGAKRPTAAFLGQVFRQNPEMAAGWLDAVQPLPEAHRRLVYEALWRSDTETSRKLLVEYQPGANPDDGRVLRALSERDPPDLLTEPIDSPARLDELWGSFFATGDRRFVERICGVFEWDVDAMPDDDVRKLLHGAAIWSVTSNISQHDAVREICSDLAKTADPPAAAILGGALAGSPQSRP